MMKGVWFDGNEPSVREDLPIPEPAPGEVLIRVELAGVCSTDLEILKGYMGFAGVIGHEFVGTVREGPDRWRNRRVVAEINCPCGDCEYCRGGLGNHCPQRGVIGISARDGAMAEYIAVPEKVLHEVPDSISNDEAVFTEPLAAALQVLEQVDVDASERVAVLGDGRIGLLCAMVLKTVTPDVLVVGTSESKLKLAARRQLYTSLLRDLDESKSRDLVVEATGSAAGMRTAMSLVRPRGKIVLKSTFAADSGPNITPLVIDEVTLVGSRCGPFEKALDALETGLVRPADLISARYHIDDAVQALRAAGDGENIKVVIEL
jgi:threonine dehydrogenase-like Zn-dependent dehydrogenase